MALKGTFTAMITPFVNDQVDEKGFVRNIQHQISAGITGLVFLGTTGEAATLTEEEQKRVIEIGVREAKGKTIIIVGTGSNSTKVAIEKTKRAKELGAEVALIVTPYYNKPTQEGIYRHFEAITSHVDIPIVVYNIQGRTGVNIETSTLLRIAGLPNVIGVKEASGNIGQAGDVLLNVRKKYPSFCVLSGDDGMTLPMMSLGATGVISVVSNLVPERVVALVDAALHGQFEKARQVHEELTPLFKLAFIEVNPTPIKYAMNFCGMAAGHCRLPLCEMKRENQEILASKLREMGLH
jgi:4-hydroxy-tetrahydrodipicolinate synthase